jgi:voltage-gated potassium channel
MNKEKNIKLFDLLIIVLSVYVLLALLISSIFYIPKEIYKLLEITDNGICLFFLIDFIRNFYNAENKYEYMKWGWIDLISSVPMLPSFRVGRLFRLIRLIRILRAFRSTKILIRYIFKSKIKGTMISVFIITLLIILASSVSILIVEKGPSCNIRTAGDAIWWTMETITTVGYGDKYPVTPEGRLIGVMLMVSGVGLFGTYTAYIASLFVNCSKDTNDSVK